MVTKSRKKLFAWNTSFSIINQLVTIICGFILPRQFLLYFGSEVNGLVSSITRFLSVIALLESGVGPVIQSCLYRPLAEKNSTELSKIVVASESFYRKIAYIFLAYIAVLAFVFPNIEQNHDAFFTGSLVIIISISTFVQYYFGITYRIVLGADQKVYFNSILAMSTTIANTIACVLLIRLGCSIHIVKLVSATVFIISPIIQNIYVQKKYHIDKSIKVPRDAIKQKWNGLIQHIAGVVTAETDVFILTFLGTLSSVSVYTVYLSIVSAVENIIMTACNGIESLWGNMYARNEAKTLDKTFSVIESILHALTTALFATTAVTIVPFILIYTRGITDANYAEPIFGMLLTFAYGAICLRVPYFRIIKVAGHFKETQKGSLISMIINIIVSLFLVKKFQLNGVAVGTLSAMLFHTFYLAYYNSKNIMKRPFRIFLGHLLIDVITGAIAVIITKNMVVEVDNYLDWILMSLKIALIAFSVVIIPNIIIYRNNFKFIKLVLKR